MNEESDDEFYESGPVPIETIEHAAYVISCFVNQGRIGPTHEDDFEVESILALLCLLVQQQEPKI